MKRTGDDDTPAGHWIIASIELSRRQRPRQHYRDNDATEQQDERMGNPEPHAREVYRKRGRVTFYLERTAEFLSYLMNPATAATQASCVSSSWAA